MDLNNFVDKLLCFSSFPAYHSTIISMRNIVDVTSAYAWLICVGIDFSTTNLQKNELLVQLDITETIYINNFQHSIQENIVHKAIPSKSFFTCKNESTFQTLPSSFQILFSRNFKRSSLLQHKNNFDTKKY